MEHILLLSGAGLMAGVMNALAGGGSFVTLPALIMAGVPSVAANATSTLALWPGGLTSVWVYRGGLRTVAGLSLVAMTVVTIIGGAIGALLLLGTPSGLFDRLLPWLLLVSTLALGLAPRIRGNIGARLPRSMLLGVQGMLGIYGGYYGGAVGLMMLAVWSLIDKGEVKALNAPRTLMVTAANSVAILCFVVAGAIRWPDALLVGAGAIVGGYGGARLGRVLPSPVIRGATLLLCIAITVLFFIRAYR
jgi:uncharacterized membrane protein YfcA